PGSDGSRRPRSLLGRCGGMDRRLLCGQRLRAHRRGDRRRMSDIHGVVGKELVTRADERGFFRESIRESDGFFDHFGQLSHSLMYPGVTKAWHIHKKQTDWWYVVGALKVALYDTRDGSPTKGNLMEFLMGDTRATCVKIPQGGAHGCRGLERSHSLYV